MLETRDRRARGAADPESAIILSRLGARKHNNSRKNGDRALTSALEKRYLKETGEEGAPGITLARFFQ